MTAELTPMGSAAVRLAERAVRLRRERDAARDLACAYEAQLAKVHALADRFAANAPAFAGDYGAALNCCADDIRAVLDVPDD